MTFVRCVYSCMSIPAMAVSAGKVFVCSPPNNSLCTNTSNIHVTDINANIKLPRGAMPAMPIRRYLEVAPPCQHIYEVLRTGSSSLAQGPGATTLACSRRSSQERGA